MPALLGLKGNLEMTLASRLSTAVSILAKRRGPRKGPWATQRCPTRDPGRPPPQAPPPVGAWSQGSSRRAWLDLVSCYRQGLPAQGDSQTCFLDVPASMDCYPTPLLYNPPRDCLCSFDRQASCCSVQPHRWGPPLISSPALQLARSRARAPPTLSAHSLSPWPVAL